jgi:4a-hydroxytetrahydrobiopterin dehydratase
VSKLADRMCRPLPAGTAPLTQARINAFLGEAPGWTHEGAAIAKTFSFANFHDTMAFVNGVAWIAHREDHHPDLIVGYDKCRVSYATHSLGGVSENDFICAAKIEALCKI